MGRRRNRVQKGSSAVQSDDGTSVSARALRTLPSAASTLRMARTQSKISELLDHAHHHVELTMRMCDGADSTGDWPNMTDMSASGSSLATAKKTGKIASIIRVLLHKKKRLVEWSGRAHDDARYNRLKHGHDTATQHLKDTESSRQILEAALKEFRKRAQAMESVLPPEPRDSRIMTTSLLACFSQSASLVDEILAVLSGEVGAQTKSKLNQLAAFNETLDQRERLYVDTQIAKQQLAHFQKLKMKHRSAIPGAYDLELAQRKHEYDTLRRRLSAMTAAVEHVFQFHAHLDQCIVEPEVTSVHNQLTRFFEKHAREFEKNVK